MTRRERTALTRYIRWVANEMNLRDWTVVLDDDPCVEGLDGSASCANSQRHIVIAVAATFRDYPPAEQRETIVHELLHAHHEYCWRMVQTDLAEPLGKIAYYMFCDQYRRAMEYTVDALAKTIAPRMPMIDWAGR